MKINRDRLRRLALFSILALFTLLLIGSEHRCNPAPAPSASARLAAELRREIPSADRAAWDRVAADNPLWLIQVSSLCE